MGCLHSKTAHLHSPEDPPTALPDSKKPDPGPPLSSFHLLFSFCSWDFYTLLFFIVWKCLFTFLVVVGFVKILH